MNRQSGYMCVGRRVGYLKLDCTNPVKLFYLSTWKGGYDEETQDCRIYDFGDGPTALFVQNNEAFVLLKPSK